MKESKKSVVGTAIIGYGYWGPNLLRTFNESNRSDVVVCCDMNLKRLRVVKNKYPAIDVTPDYDKVLTNSKVDAVVIATPLSTHYLLAKKALLANKHVWIEKPMTENSVQAKELVELARKKKKVIQVDHIFLYTQAVTEIKRMIDSKEIGKSYYFDSVRINLGLFQPDSNVVWDLAIHDITIMCHLLGKTPKSVSAFGTSHIRNNLEDTAYLNFNFSEKVSAHVAVSWLSPVKIRKTIIAGSKKMVIYDDLETSEKVKVYDYGVSFSKRYRPESSTAGYQYRIGNIRIPALENKEALQNACAHFIDCILYNKIPLTDGVAGLNCIKVLEAASLSLKNNSREQRI